MLEIRNTTQQKFCRRKAKKITEAVLNFYKLKEAEVSLVVIGDQKMRTLNRDFHGQDKTTDVLSFPADKKIPQPQASQGGKYLGEIFINISESARVPKYQAMFTELAEQTSGAKGQKRIKYYPKSSAYIFYFLLIHGLLHLIGYSDKTDKERRTMIALGEKFLKKWYN